MKKLFYLIKKYGLLVLGFGIATTFITYFFILPYFQKQHALDDIRNGELCYYSSVGWIDLGHAKPDGPLRLVAEIDKHRGGTLTYSQDMKKSLFGVTFVVRKTNRYSIPVDIGKDRAGILRYIFEDVSKDFEALQASHPFRALCGRGVGDINGDRLALLRSLGKEDPDFLQHPVSADAALEKFKHGVDLDSTSSYLKTLLPKRVWVYKWKSTIEYSIQ